MRHIHLPAATAIALVIAQTGAVYAQATRTWVSGVGDDVNPCSRTAPCKTFAGAISKTAAGGEIDTLDPGGYGTVTITKSITIDGGSGIGSILASATNGINVNAGASDRVVLRNLTINGAGTTLGVNGINILAGNAVEIENVKIMNFSQSCISFAPSAKANLLVSNTSMSSCGASAIKTLGPAGGNSLLQLNNSSIYKSGVGISVGLNTVAGISNSVIANNGGGGVLATGASAQIDLDSSFIMNNTTFGVKADQTSIVRIGKTNVTGNDGTGLLFTNSGQILSWQNNLVAGNAPDGAPSGTIAAK